MPVQTLFKEARTAALKSSGPALMRKEGSRLSFRQR